MPYVMRPTRAFSGRSPMARRIDDLTKPNSSSMIHVSRTKRKTGGGDESAADGSPPGASGGLAYSTVEHCWYSSPGTLVSDMAA